MNGITGLILTYNEKENIERTLRALHWLPLVVLIDSYSTDDTIARARNAHPNVKVIERAFDSFARQCNFGLTQIETEWVLSMDADYIVPPDLAQEIGELGDESGTAGYSAGFQYNVFGHALRTTIYPPRTVLYRKAAAVYRDEGHGHRVTISGPVKPLSAPIIHDDRKPLTRWLASQDQYARIEAIHLLAASDSPRSLQDRLRLGVFWAVPGMFVYLLFCKGLILDGWPGWFYVCQRVTAELILSVRLLIEKHGLEGPKRAP